MQDQFGNTVRVWRDEDIEYSVVELTVVTDNEIEQALNQRREQGWHFESIHFSMWEGSKRPSMAFLLFVRIKDNTQDQDARS